MDPLQILETGEITPEGQFMWGSNYTLLVNVACGADLVQAVYKPTEGVRPLWDFDSPSLARREVLAYLVSRELGWDLVPPTVFRAHGPYGPGSLQLFVDHDPDQHFFTFSDDFRMVLRPAALFDVIINNADRKGGHFILDPTGHVWLIDHGVCFHEDPKLRTVLWEFAGEAIPDDLAETLEAFRAGLEPDRPFGISVRGFLTDREAAAMIRRVDRLISRRVFPAPPGNTRPYPWPLV